MRHSCHHLRSMQQSAAVRPQAADSYSTFLASCVTAAVSKGSLLSLLHTMLQLLPNERLLHLQVHQRIMADSIGGKYRPARPSLTRHLVTYALFTAAQGLQR